MLKVLPGLTKVSFCNGIRNFKNNVAFSGVGKMSTPDTFEKSNYGLSLSAFDVDIYNALIDYREALFSEKPKEPKEEFYENCSKEKVKAVKNFEALEAYRKEISKKGEITMKKEEELYDKSDEMVDYYEFLNSDDTMKEIFNLKSMLDEYDKNSYFKIASNVKSQYGNAAFDYLKPALVEEVGRKTFKASPVYFEIMEAAEKLGLEGDENEKVKNLMKLAQDNKLGRGGQGSVYRIPETNLAIKVFNRATGLPQDLDDFQYVANISEYDRVNNVLAKKENYEIQEYIEGIRCLEDSPREAYAQQIITDMPQSAYDEFLKRATEIAKAGRGIDIFDGNIIVDFKNSRFVPIDLFATKDFEGDYKSDIDFFGNHYIDPFAYTLGQFPKPQSEEQSKIQIGKILKSIARDCDNYEMYFFDTGNFFRNPKRLLPEYCNFDKKLVKEVDKKLKNMHTVKVKLLKSSNENDKKKLNETIETFCRFIDENLLSSD